MKYPRVCLSALLLAWCLAGCDYEDDDHDHDVPPGLGSLIVDNNTADDIAIFIDSVRANNVDGYEHKSFDLRPGVHRVVLDERGGENSFHDDVDILEGRRTIMDIGSADSDGDYDVAVFFD